MEGGGAFRSRCVRENAPWLCGLDHGHAVELTTSPTSKNNDEKARKSRRLWKSSNNYAIVSYFACHLFTSNHSVPLGVGCVLVSGAVIVVAQLHVCIWGTYSVRAHDTRLSVLRARAGAYCMEYERTKPCMHHSRHDHHTNPHPHTR